MKKNIERLISQLEQRAKICWESGKRCSEVHDIAWREYFQGRACLMEEIVNDLKDILKEG